MGTFERELIGHDGWVSSICIRNKVLVSGSRDKNVIIWNETSPNVYDSILSVLKGHEDYIQSVHLNSDSSLIASASWDKTVKVWEVKNGTEKTTLNHQSEVFCVKFTDDNLYLISSSKNNSIHIWDYNNYQKIYTFRTTSPPMKFELTPAAPINFFAALENGQISRGSLDSKKIDLLLDLKNGNYFTKRLNTISISPDGSIVSAGGIDQKLVLFNSSNDQFEYLSNFKVQSTINDTGFSPNRYWSIIIANKGIFIYDLEAKTLVFTHLSESASSVPISFAFSEDGSYLYVGYTDHSIRVWNFTSDFYPALEFPFSTMESSEWPIESASDWGETSNSDWTTTGNEWPDY